MMYEDAIRLYQTAGKFTHPPTLSRMRALCRALGDPQDSLRFVHIAGTNGKGSCAAMLASICRCAGWRTGLYTSPDLVDFSERIQIDGVRIAPGDTARLTARIAAAAEKLPPLSFFELVTALAFLYFAEQRCDIVILECGLGGRFDATNVIRTAEASVIMPVGLDHTAVLGSTLDRIAGEKAGVVKPGRPVVCAPQLSQALAPIRARCAELDAPLHTVEPKDIRVLSDSLSGQDFRFGDRPPLHISLLGAHQLENAAAALLTAGLLGLDGECIRAGLAAARWPCRFELMAQRPPLVLDGAHNPHGAAALAAGLRHYFPGEKFVFILGVMADKDVDGILARLTPLAARFYCVAPDSPRALPAAELARRIRGVPAEPCADPLEALVRARALPLGCCACGSLYFTGLLRQKLIDADRAI